MRELELLAPAKINWSLDVVGTTENGYHLLRSLMQNIDLADRIRLSVGDLDQCSCSPYVSCAMEDNLAYRAWRLMKEKFSLPGGLEIHIEKHIPAGGGLAGGSSDAAAVMRGVNQLFSLGLTQQQLYDLGVKLGADIPFCLSGGFSLVEGIGEKITPLTGLEYDLVIINPGFSVSTPAVYHELDKEEISVHPDLDTLQQALADKNFSALREALGNVLEPPAFRLHPDLLAAKTLCASYGEAALMSGSGGSMWILAGSYDMANQIAEALNGHFPVVAVAKTKNERLILQ